MKRRILDFGVKVIVPAEDRQFLTVTVGEQPAPEPISDDDTPAPRLRRMSESGTGRGTGRGGKEPASKLTNPLKPYGKRADFIRFVGEREVGILEIMKQFSMSRANVNGFLTNIHRDHGIGYTKDNTTMKFILPKKSTWANVWRT